MSRSTELGLAVSKALSKNLRKREQWISKWLAVSPLVTAHKTHIRRYSPLRVNLLKMICSINSLLHGFWHESKNLKGNIRDPHHFGREQRMRMIRSQKVKKVIVNFQIYGLLQKGWSFRFNSLEYIKERHGIRNFNFL